MICSRVSFGATVRLVAAAVSCAVAPKAPALTTATVRLVAAAVSCAVAPKAPALTSRPARPAATIRCMAVPQGKSRRLATGRSAPQPPEVPHGAVPHAALPCTPLPRACPEPLHAPHPHHDRPRPRPALDGRAGAGHQTIDRRRMGSVPDRHAPPVAGDAAADT